MNHRANPSLVKEKKTLVVESSGQSTASRYEALISVSAALGTHNDTERLFSALSTELLRVLHFDFIGLSRYDDTTARVDWYLLSPDGPIKRGVIDGTKEETMSAWVYQHQYPMIIASLDQETWFHRKIKELAQEEIRSICAFPLTCNHNQIGCFFVGSKQADAYTVEDIRFMGLIADMIASAVQSALSFNALSRTREELQCERDRLGVLLDLNAQIASNLELRELLRTVSATVCRVARCDGVAVHLPDRESSSLRLVTLCSPEATRTEPEGCSWLVESASREDICEVFRAGKPALNPQCCSCAVPLASRNEVLGVLEFRAMENQAMGTYDLEFLSRIAGYVAIAVANAIAYGKIKDLKDKLAREKLYLEDEIRSEQGFEEIIGRSPAIRAMLRQIEAVAPTEATVLIYGETGTGKELVARAIHERSGRSSHAFVKLNCAAIPTGLLESELFGHEKGAFTGAITQRTGRFELANRGTAFLDEIGEMELELQPKLLRVLQEREFERLGSGRTIKTDARLIAATNRNLLAYVEERRFREDLFYRLNVFPIQVPPLRERPEDIPLLVRHFAQYFARRISRLIDTIPSETMEALVRHSWPGNIRELQNLIEHAVIVSPGPVLRVPLTHLHTRSVPQSDISKSRTLEENEREHILTTLKETKWVVSGPNGAAARLGINRSTLQFRMRKLGILRLRDAVSHVLL